MTQTVAPTRSKPFIIEDWAGNRIFPGETFTTFDDAIERIWRHAESLAEGDTEAAREADFEESCCDLYAIDARNERIYA